MHRMNFVVASLATAVQLCTRGTLPTCNIARVCSRLSRLHMAKCGGLELRLSPHATSYCKHTLQTLKSSSSTRVRLLEAAQTLMIEVTLVHKWSLGHLLEAPQAHVT
ncbi:hypothetical protein BU16DRAFT_227305 [Lophium mytilinum]|uniref:Secreted protein n=1 Tax=Lophium mytilinum TaxID=390894 RepID=A0A6A6QA24_9PEZI|nr:hypothetical protein BU16DRAFT_227305 [Lophium mytilinum]